MLKLYYARPSLFARPVWLALLEKQVSFELVPVNLNGDQFNPEFMALNPFSHIPVLVDGDFRAIESIAILDYLEAKYPNPPLLPADAKTLATVRMVQLVAVNELLPAVARLIMYDSRSDESKYGHLQAINVLNFWEPLLGNFPYFAGEQLTVAEIVAGMLVCTLPDLGISFANYPRLQAWSDRLLARPTWQQVQLSSEEWTSFKRHLRVMPKTWERRRRQRVKALAQ
ncbi:glutathione S-transferase family protein [Altericista sp. CCNU0014]|uniref:glutathione S-transferase family protein n=1 Tax=Altericista sp. CCNU0014 TaxID=3082949 RepID=UPI00385176C0